MEQELKHHGIEGQKWGQRNGPPYPLDPKDYSKAEKQANKISNAIASGSGREIKKRDLRRVKKVDKLSNKRKIYDTDLTEEQKVGKLHVLESLNGISYAGRALAGAYAGAAIGTGAAVPSAKKQFTVKAQLSADAKALADASKYGLEAGKSALSGNYGKSWLVAKAAAARSARMTDPNYRFGFQLGKGAGIGAQVGAIGGIASTVVTNASMAKRRSYLRTMDPDLRKALYSATARLKPNETYAVVNTLYKANAYANKLQTMEQRDAYLSTVLKQLNT